LLNIVQRSRTS